MEAPGIQPCLDVGIGLCHGDDDWDIHHPGNGQQIQVRDGGVEHNAHGALPLHILGQLQGAHPLGGAASDAAEDRDVRSLNDGMADGLLRCEWINGKYGVCVTIADDRKIGGENKAFEPPPVDHDAAGGINFLRHPENVPQAAFYIGRGLLFGSHGCALLSHFLEWNEIQYKEDPPQNQETGREQTATKNPVVSVVRMRRDALFSAGFSGWPCGDSPGYLPASGPVRLRRRR